MAIFSTNDAFVLANWANSLKASDLLMLADGNGEFTREIGMQLDLSGKGMGPRSKRCALVVKDGTVKYVGTDGEELKETSAERILKFL